MFHVCVDGHGGAFPNVCRAKEHPVHLPPFLHGCLCLALLGAAYGCSGRNQTVPRKGGSNDSGAGRRPDGGRDEPRDGSAARDGSMGDAGGHEAPCPFCDEHTLGSGGAGFDLDRDPNDGVGLAPDGSLVLDPGTDDAAQFIWISNTADVPSTVSKVDTRAMREVARYQVGAHDPSRTSVSITGDAYIGSRAGRGVTKISSLGADCTDRNGDGMVTTSTGPDDVLPFGQDDCVLWFTALDEEIRGVAAQDVPSETVVIGGLDGPPTITQTPSAHYVWAGGGTNKKLYKLHGETGEILIETTAPRGVYGLALDGAGKLWITGGAHWEGSLAFVDTTRCVSNLTCEETVCEAKCSVSACPSTCDGAIKANIELSPPEAYGITVDCKQRVWLGGYGGGIKRYDPAAQANQRLKVAHPSTAGVHGITADAKGWIWGANPGTGVIRLHGDTLGESVLVPAPQPKGIAVDPQGKIWAVTQGDSAHVITPGAALNDNVVTERAVEGLASPYTYSDMTGEQLRLATQEPGTYRHVFEGCTVGGTSWNTLSYETDTPEGTKVVFRARSADSVAELDAAPWFAVATAPYRDSPASLAEAAARYSMTLGEYVEVEVELTREGAAARDRCADAKTPKVKSFGVSFTCDAVIK